VTVSKQVDNPGCWNRILDEEIPGKTGHGCGPEVWNRGALGIRALGAVALAVLFAASFLLPGTGLGITTCAFKNTIGVPCPGCGLTRSFVAVSHGRPATAFREHPLGVFIYAGLAVYMAKWALEASIRRRLLARLEERARVPVLWALVLGMMGVWLCKLATGALI